MHAPAPDTADERIPPHVSLRVCVSPRALWVQRLPSFFTFLKDFIEKETLAVFYHESPRAFKGVGGGRRSHVLTHDAHMA